MNTYDIETVCEMFNGDAHQFLLDIIQESSPDYFTEDQLDMACEIEEGKRRYFPTEHDNFETIEYDYRLNR